MSGVDVLCVDTPSSASASPASTPSASPAASSAPTSPACSPHGRLPPVLPSPARSGCSWTGPGSPRSWRKKPCEARWILVRQVGSAKKNGAKMTENGSRCNIWWRIMVCLTGGLTLRRGRLTVPSLYFRKFVFVWQVVPEEWVAWGTLHSKECATHNKNKKRTPQKKQSVNASPYHLLIVQWAKCCSSKSNNENEQTEFEHLETLEQLQDELRQAKAHGAKAQSMVEANESLVKDHAVLKAELGTVPLIWKLRRMKSKSWVQACLIRSRSDVKWIQKRLPQKSPYPNLPFPPYMSFPPIGVPMDLLPFEPPQMPSELISTADTEPAYIECSSFFNESIFGSTDADW